MRSRSTTHTGRGPETTIVVLAGANVPREVDALGIPFGDDGILTAEAIAGMKLLGLELAVLSACETGLGDVAGGEGMYGLQRAFHTAGTENVVASLWKVEDQATAALMRLFYRKLLTEKQSPLQALRESQLAMYRYPDQIPKLARTRGPDYDKVVKFVGKKKTPSSTQPTNIQLWAAFVLSGAGR